VLKRDMEFAMMDELVKNCRMQGISVIYGYFYPTGKNAMVKDFFAIQGFDKLNEDGAKTVWKFEIPNDYKNKNYYIEIAENNDKTQGDNHE
jgi:predicted enzyme involved in methoxymalonyl-ACP biosynthesis